MYTDFDQALNRARERAAALVSDNGYLGELLEISKGRNIATNQDVYRPFYVAAKYLEQSRRDQTLKSDNGAEFTRQATPIQSLLDMQAALDAELVIPRAFQINPAMPDMKQIKAAYDSALLFLIRYQPRGML